MSYRSDFETEEFYNEVYDILMKQAGAIGGWQRESFVFHFMQSEPPREWRFQGLLGFGGKFWRNDGRIYVNCYSEDRTPARERMIEATNKALDELVQQALAGV
jgi:hypothetical protein